MRLLRPGIAFVVLLASLPSSLLGRQLTLEYEVKAAFVLNFVRYVEWPLPARTPPLRVCVFRDNPFGNRLDAVVADERWQGGNIEVKTIQDLRDARECHLLYVAASATDSFIAGAAQVATLPVLTVGETPMFLEQGGMIQLLLENNRVRFAINRRSAEHAGLQISSRLLRLARTVVGAPGAALR